MKDIDFWHWTYHHFEHQQEEVKMKDILANLALFIIVIAYTFGAIIGAIVAATNGESWDVLWSLLIPFYGAIYAIAQLF